MDLFYKAWLFVQSFCAHKEDKSSSLQTRMKYYKCMNKGEISYPYKAHVFSVQSKTLLAYINKICDIEEKENALQELNKALVQVCKDVYDMFDPQMIYSFNNEIHLVFYYDDNTTHVLYNGDIAKILTRLTSYITLLFSKYFVSNAINSIVFDGHFIEFDKEYEILNYIIWRQFDCYRNNITLLYKCVHSKDIAENKTFVEHTKLTDMLEEMQSVHAIQDVFLYGNVIKKKIYAKIDAKDFCLVDTTQHTSTNATQQDPTKTEHAAANCVYRRKIHVENNSLCEHFTDKFYKYVATKYLSE